MFSSNNHIEIFTKIESEHYLTKLIEQLNKDFKLANIDSVFGSELLITEVNEQLNKLIYKLITTQYDDYLNLLYETYGCNQDKYFYKTAKIYNLLSL